MSMNNSAMKKQLTGALFVLQLVWMVTAQAQEVAPYEPNLNLTTPLEDFIIENRRQNAANIKSYELQVANFRATYQQQLSTVGGQTALIEERLQQLDQKLTPLEVLDDVSKHCVQKYRSIIVQTAAVKLTMSNCVTVGNNAANNLISSAETTQRNLNNYYNNNLNSGLNDCKRKHATAYLNYTVCVTQVINSANVYTIGNQKTFSTQIQAAKCNAESQVRSAVDCSFSALYLAISSIGEATRLIDNCIAGVEFCAPCNNTEVDDKPEPCPNIIYMQLDQDSRNATVQNPFSNINSTWSCVQVYFVRAPIAVK